MARNRQPFQEAWIAPFQKYSYTYAGAPDRTILPRAWIATLPRYITRVAKRRTLGTWTRQSFQEECIATLPSYITRMTKRQDGGDLDQAILPRGVDCRPSKAYILGAKAPIRWSPRSDNPSKRCGLPPFRGIYNGAKAVGRWGLGLDNPSKRRGLPPSPGRKLGPRLDNPSKMRGLPPSQRRKLAP